MNPYKSLTYESIDDGSIAIVTVNQPPQQGATHRRLLVELDAVMSEAQYNDAVRVVILRGVGTAFCSEHDLVSQDAPSEDEPPSRQDPTAGGCGGTRDGVERTWLQEHFLVQNLRRLRDLRKITIASVDGPVYAAGLMMIWACDLIVADTTAQFADVSGARLGMCGVEYFAHPWEFGARRAKDLLLTGDSLSAKEAYRLGMVSRIFQPADLQEETVGYARRIAALPSATSLMVKDSVNQAQDHKGFHVSLQASFNLHELNHGYYAMQSDGLSFVHSPELGGMPLNARSPVVPASGSEVGATGARVTG